MLSTAPTKERTAENIIRHNNNITHTIITQNIITRIITTQRRKLNQTLSTGA